MTRLAFFLALLFANTWQEAEIVDVRDRGPVDLKPFACHDITRSSVISRVCYDGASRRMAAALLAYEAKVTTSQRSGLTIGDLLGDGSDGAADNALQPGEMIGSIELPAPVAGERAIYKRAISRTHAEWPLVEVCARAAVKDGVFQFIRVTAGGIAPVPLRLVAVEAALQGKGANVATIAVAAKQAVSGAKPLPMTGYKLDLLKGVVQDVLERLTG